MPAKKMTDAEHRAYFWSRVNKSEDPWDCWEYPGSPGVFGYIQIKRHKRTFMAHRVAWQYEVGPIPTGMHILHACDNPRCVNPCHLRVGTRFDNMADMERRGRSDHPKGERHPRAKLTWVKVREIRARYAAGGVSQRALATEYGTWPQVVSLIIRGKVWKDDLMLPLDLPARVPGSARRR